MLRATNSSIHMPPELRELAMRNERQGAVKEKEDLRKKNGKDLTPAETQVQATQKKTNQKAPNEKCGSESADEDFRT